MSLAGRPSVRARDHRNGVALVDNPRWPKEHGLMWACHDGSPAIDFECAKCNGLLHAHEAQIADAPPNKDIGLRCPLCKEQIIVSRRFLERGFKAARQAMQKTKDAA